MLGRIQYPVEMHLNQLGGQSVRQHFVLRSPIMERPTSRYENHLSVPKAQHSNSKVRTTVGNVAVHDLLVIVITPRPTLRVHIATFVTFGTANHCADVIDDTQAIWWQNCVDPRLTGRSTSTMADATHVL
jgi:hypothetical protein